MDPSGKENVCKGRRLQPCFVCDICPPENNQYCYFYADNDMPSYFLRLRYRTTLIPTVALKANLKLAQLATRWIELSHFCELRVNAYKQGNIWCAICVAAKLWATTAAANNVQIKQHLSLKTTVRNTGRETYIISWLA